MCFSLTHLVAWTVPDIEDIDYSKVTSTVERSGLKRHICRPPLCLPKEPIRFHTSVKTSLLAEYWIMLYARFFKCFCFLSFSVSSVMQTWSVDCEHITIRIQSVYCLQ